MNGRQAAICFLVVSVVLIVGYFLMMYGGNLSEISGKYNAYMVVGEILMWPWIVIVFIKKQLFHSDTNIGLICFWAINYTGYFLLIYVCRMIRSG